MAMHQFMHAMRVKPETQAIHAIHIRQAQIQQDVDEYCNGYCYDDECECEDYNISDDEGESESDSEEEEYIVLKTAPSKPKPIKN